MSEESEPQVQTTWADTFKVLAEGGLPQVIAGPAGKAIARLIAGAAEIPAAFFEKIAQGIRDETAARSAIVKAISLSAASSAAENPALMERALRRYVSELSIKQRNREAIGAKTIERLVDDPPFDQAAVPPDDWMSLFESYAERASSDHLQDIWARVLAGEIRRPASFSLQTLQFISVLDQPIASAAETLLSYTVNGDFALLPAEMLGAPFKQLSMARFAGLIGQLDRDTRKLVILDDADTTSFALGDTLIIAHGELGSRIQIDCVSVSEIAGQLSRIIRPTASTEAVDRLTGILRMSSGITSIERGSIASGHGDAAVAKDLRTIWRRSE